jgi:hypothetical protein
MALLFTLPRSNQFDAVGQLMSGWTIEFYASGTSTPTIVYADYNLSAPLGSSVQTGDDGSLRPIYLDDSRTAYKILVKDSNGEIVPNGTIDPYLVGPSQNQLGRALYPQTEAEEAAGVVPTNFAYFTPIGIDVRRFGVVGDGTTDDSAAMAIAISTGQPLDLGNLTIRMVTKVTFNRAHQHIYARGGGFKWDGVATTRLADITATGVEFHGVDFDGNENEVRAALVYVASNAARPKFRDCRFRRINGTHIQGDTQNGNSQYAILISPYGVAGLDIDGCLFEDISNTNDGTNGIGDIEGAGFCGGLLIGITDDWAEPDTVQTVYTSGSIRNCQFKNIRTVLSSGLAEAEQINYQDADAIRLYGAAAGHTRLYIHIDHCYFEDVAKRAVKCARSGGIRMSNLDVVATSALQYQMVCVVKLDGEGVTLDGLSVQSPAESPVQIVIGSHDCTNLNVSNVKADRCIWFWDVSPFTTDVVLSGWNVRGLQCDSCRDFGIRYTTLADHYENVRFEDISLTATFGIHDFLAFVLEANTSRMEVELRNARLIGGDIKIGGYGWTLSNVYHEINDASYTGSTSTRPILECGLPAGTAVTRRSTIDNYELNIKALPDAYLHAGRQTLFLVYGDRVCVANMRVAVPDALADTYEHGAFDGNDLSINGFEYSGEGYIRINQFTGGTKRRTTIRGARRIGGTTATTTFLHFGLSQDCAISDIEDYRDSPDGSITILSGTVSGSHADAYVIDGVRSMTTAANVVTDGGSLAAQIDVQKF